MNELVKDMRNRIWNELRIKAEISYVLKNEDNEIRALAYDSEDPSNLFGLAGNLNGNIFVNTIPDWDFNVDDYLLRDLEEGYRIAFMPLGEHYNVWCAIAAMDEDIDHTRGLQEYLRHCQTHDITQSTIETFGTSAVNIMKMYQEENHGYRIIADYTVNKVSYVIGHDPKAPSPYAVWRTSYNRTRGYDIGHYFNDFDDAFSDFKSRIQDEVDKQVYLKRKCFRKEERRNDAR